MNGRLVLVATPIGNLGDLSPRASAALAGADVIACEDTRRTGRLLQLAGIERRPLLLVNDHTEDGRTREIVDEVSSGRTVVLVSDAGTPGVSDPGQRLVAAVAEAGGTVEVIPGPSAPLAALVVSGLPTARFVMEGFLPRKGSARRDRVHQIAAEERTVLILESPHRLVATLEDLAEACGEERRVAVARELTKLHEETWRGTLSEAAAEFSVRSKVGEVVLVVEGAPPPGDVDDGAIVAELQRLLDQGSTVRDAVTATAQSLSVGRRRVYGLAIGLE